MTHVVRSEAAVMSGFMWQGLIFRCLLVIMAGVCVPLAHAADQPDTAADDGLVLLQKVQQAARTLDYAGVYTYQQGATMQSSRITHLVDGTGERERIEALDGTPREFLRQGDRIQCLIPERKLVILERRRGDRFPALLLGEAEGISQYYQINTIESHDRVAGRECTLIEVIPRDSHRYGYRLCVDDKTQLLLRAQTLSHDSVVIDQVAFNSLVLGDKVSASDLDSQWSTRDWKVLETSMAAVDISKKGWRVPYPDGFVAISQVSRLLRQDHHVKQLVLSDGLAAISVFIELIDPVTERTVVQGTMKNGAMNIFRTRIGDYWLTALGEVPAATLRDLAQHAEYVPLAVHDQ